MKLVKIGTKQSNYLGGANMPELVEVETTRRDLSKIIKNKKINKVDVFLDKIVYNKKSEFIN